MQRVSSTRAQQSALIVLSAIALCLSACGGDHPKTIRVNGKVTFDGGPCPAEGYINFEPIEPAEGYPRRPTSAHFGPDGVFSVMSYEPNDGIVPGSYRVSIECWKELPDEATFSPGVSYVPEGFDPGELVVEPDANQPMDVSFDVHP